ncbi:MAG: YkvA family protein [Gloeomargarita sp. SKYB31]|nr:YkvA family protein [Gloeomargarita sp. SKYB31]
MQPFASFYRWYRDTLRHSPYRWLLIVGSLLYLLSPVDIAPDVFPFLGWIDDGWLLAILVGELSTLLFGGASASPTDGPVVDVQARSIPDDE